MATGGEYELGFDDNRFETAVSENFHCLICFLVLKDPVMCKNQHYFCSSCIKKYLETAESCPTCREHLSVETLSEVPRIVIDLLSELNIRCDFYPRGCREVVQVSNLKRHVEICGFSPVQCANDGCNVLVNLRDMLHHEAQACDFRRLKCHDCGQLKQEMKDMKEEMLTRQDQMKNEMKVMNDEMKNEVKALFENEMKVMSEELKVERKEMLDQVLGRQDQMQGKIANDMIEEMGNGTKNEMKEEIRGMKVEMKNEMKEMREEMKNEMKEMKEEMKNEIREIVMNAVRDTTARPNYIAVDMKNSKEDSQACSSERKANILVTGGVDCEVYRYRSGKKGKTYEMRGRLVRNRSTECFNWADHAWTRLNTAETEGLSGSCSFMYQDQMMVTGGFDGVNMTNAVKSLNVANPAVTWKNFAVNLPIQCCGHKVVNYNNRLIMSGGCVKPNDGRLSTRSGAVYEIQLVPPYSSEMLTRLPQPRSSHGMELTHEKVFILGGCHNDTEATNSVLQYNLVKNECNEMPPLPYAVHEMATVLWGNNVLVLGGKDARDNHLNKVIMYDVITGHSQMLPCMKSTRSGCTAVLTGNVVVVMGGYGNAGYEGGYGETYLKSVECFDLERRVWQDLPDMLEPRRYATAVAKPTP